MRSIWVLIQIYLLGLAVYFGWLGVAWWGTHSVETQVRSLGASYTNAIQLRARFEVLKERQELKFAGLDCWKIVAAQCPDGPVLQGFTFNDGQRLTLNGTAKSEEVAALIDFDSAIRKTKLEGKPFFATGKGDPLSYRAGAGGVMNWNFSLELQRTEAK
jgi:hypothetical protein